MPFPLQSKMDTQNLPYVFFKRSAFPPENCGGEWAEVTTPLRALSSCYRHVPRAHATCITQEGFLTVLRLGGSVLSDSATPQTAAHQASSVHGILQARILEWGAISSSSYYVCCNNFHYNTNPVNYSCHKGMSLLYSWPPHCGQECPFISSWYMLHVYLSLVLLEYAVLLRVKIEMVPSFIFIWSEA